MSFEKGSMRELSAVEVQAVSGGAGGFLGVLGSVITFLLNNIGSLAAIREQVKYRFPQLGLK
ncbi:hypothetical protein [Commensalibacter oyaizuii]|uniref:Bacteriocin n=1 Tax=Commensalibacter oyaizuii TaxID=3043873 RepID=A0ABT6Q326_9PROT|nr:hypothetical protein [Commensalibacter sp. TBRC 16381]MDI2091420.1 hypothetical protein [Commensalibacter sp. TBRC 16381]